MIDTAPVILPAREWTRSFRNVALVLSCVLASGCVGDITTDYGSRNGGSVNGTGVLADMLEARGHQVSTWPWLSPRLSRDADCIVWFPDDFGPPDEKVRTWLEDWLLAKPHRTLIYVGRDFDAATSYWRLARQGSTGVEYSDFSRRLAEANAEFHKRRGTPKAAEAGAWFSLEPGNPRAIRDLTGEERWVSDIDVKQIQLEISTRLIPPAKANIWLAGDNDVLVSREPWGDSQLIVITNGSFLLNLPLVNHEHRKLAGQLIAEIGPPAQHVFFLEARDHQPAIHAEEPKTSAPNSLHFISVWPLGMVLTHLAILGTVFMVSRFPIFGVPRDRNDYHASDFGLHVVALGDLLAQTRDEEYARGRLKTYYEKVRGDARSTAPANRALASDMPTMPPSANATPPAPPADSERIGQSP